jgi:virulence-associated protein VapD
MRHRIANWNRRRTTVSVVRDADQSSADTGPYLPNSFQWGSRVYAIAFDLDSELLKAHYPNASFTHGYDDINRIFGDHGFTRQQGSVYFGGPKVTPVSCVLAVQEVARQCPWFAKAVRDIRMLRIEENNDLMPAVGELELEFNAPPKPAAAE